MTNELAQAIEQLRQENIRITPQRYAVLEYIIHSESHPTADEIYQALVAEFPGVSVATIYNNLRTFKEHGLIQEMKFGDDSSRFDTISKPHYHVICKKCGQIQDFYYPGLVDVEMAVGQLTGFLIEEHRLEVYGLCPSCQKEEHV